MEFKNLLGFLLLLEAMTCLSAQQNAFYEKRVETCLIENNNSLAKCLQFFLDDINTKYSTVGLPDLNIPPFDPIHLENLKFQRDDGTISLKAIFKNVLASGFTQRNITRIRFNKDTKTISLRVKIPTFFIKGLYDLRGQVFGINITGNGDFTADVDQVFANLKTTVLEKNVDGKQILTVGNTILNLKFQKVLTHLDNLFDGDKVMGDTVNHFINSKSDLILKEVDTELTTRIVELIDPMLKRGMSYFPPEIIV